MSLSDIEYVSDIDFETVVDIQVKLCLRKLNIYYIYFINIT